MLIFIDYAKGFGGKFGIDDRQDKNAAGWDYHADLAVHESQKGMIWFIIIDWLISCLDYAVGFGGRHGIQKERQDKSAAGYDYHEQLAQHESQRGNINY